MRGSVLCLLRAGIPQERGSEGVRQSSSEGQGREDRTPVQENLSHGKRHGTQFFFSLTVMHH